MKAFIKCKPFICILLSMTIFFASTPLIATTTTPPIDPPPITTSNSNHNETILQFISEIRLIQNQVFDIAQFALSNQPLLQQKLAPNITTIDNLIRRLDIRITDYLEAVPDISLQNRDVLLLLNALNLVKNGLYTLSLLTAANTDVQRILLLDEFFRSRIAAKDTLATIERLILIP